MKLSFIVCTRNRATALIPCLTSIAELLAHAAPLDAEIVVVDNGSNDDTSSAVKNWADSCDYPVNLQLEPRPGLSRARNRGLRVAKGEIFVFTDDDCRLSKDYVSELLRHYAADTEPVMRGGRVELGDITDLPISIKTEQAVQRWQKTKRIPKNHGVGYCLAGCNMTMSRAVLERVGLFDERFGCGSDIRAGEDTDYIFRVYLAHIAIEYVPDMIVYHHHGRKELATGKAVMQNYVVSKGAIYAKYFFRNPGFCRPAYWAAKNACKEILSGKNLYWKEMDFSYKNTVTCLATGALKFLSVSMKKAS